MPNYKFYLQCLSESDVYTTGSDHILADKGWHQFYPGVTRDVAVEYDIWDHKYRRKFKGDLTFLNRTQTDYTYLSQIDSKSAEVKVRIEQDCGVTTSSDWWEGYFSIIDGEWDADRGLYSVTPSPNDIYRLLEEQSDKSFNIINLLTHTLAEKMVYGTVEVELISTEVAEGTSHDTFQVDNPTYPNDERGKFTDLWSYYAQCGFTYEGASPGNYFLIWKKQVSYVKLNDSFVYDAGDTAFSSPSCTQDVSITLNARGLLLKDVITYIVNALAGISYKSSFFQNDNLPDGTPVTENYVTEAANKLTRLVLYQKSDIKPTSDPATIGEFTFGDLMQWLKDLFNVDWFIDENGDFRIEHWKYFDTTIGSDIDLTTLDGGKWAYHKNKWSYEIENMPNIEKFEMMEAYEYEFRPTQIIYDRVATYNRYKDNVKDRIVPFTTDVAFAYGTPDAISNEGWILLQTNSSDFIENETGILSGWPIVNAHLSYAHLLDKYWRHGRIIGTGTMNGTPVTFDSYQKNIKQTEITYPECCGTFDPMATKITGLGEGEVRGAEFRLIDGTVKSVFFYLDVKASGFIPDETYYISTDGVFDILINGTDKLIFFG